jgi:hypothetical protein
VFFPGETITHRFVVPFAVKEINKVVVSYKQHESIILEKTIATGFKGEGTNITSFEIPFSQQDSLVFDDNVPFSMQINVFTNVGTRHTSKEMNSSSGIQYLRDVISPDAGSIVAQPTDWVVSTVGETAQFVVVAIGISLYRWQYSVNGGAWQAAPNGSNDKLIVTATRDKIGQYRYRCVMTDVYGAELITDTVILKFA